MALIIPLLSLTFPLAKHEQQHHMLPGSWKDEENKDLDTQKGRGNHSHLNWYMQV